LRRPDYMRSCALRYTSGRRELHTRTEEASTWAHEPKHWRRSTRPRPPS
jgi:hypothetical protein